MHAVLHARRSSGPALAYVPGIDGTGEYLLETGPRLEARFELLRFAYRLGQGEEESYPALAASIARVLRAEGVAPALVLAESFGVGVALQLALDHPDCVRALALVNGFARYDRRVNLAFARSSRTLAAQQATLPSPDPR